MANIPTTSWDESSPVGTQTKSLGATKIRELKTQVREIFDNDHIWESSGNGGSWGYHNRVSFVPQTSNQYPPANSGQLFVKTISSKPELFWVNESDSVQQLTSNGNFICGLVGEVRMFKGLLANISIGWALCDGIGGRPNLIAKFIRGINTSITEPGGTGGANTITLNEVNLPSHIHNPDIDDGNHVHAIHTHYNSSTTGPQRFEGMIGPPYENYDNENTDLDGSHTHSINTTGNSIAFDIRPAYYEVAFIIKT